MECTRCNKKIRVSYTVAGYPGLYGIQCALEVCQGRRYMLRKVAEQPTPLTQAEIDEMKSLPYGGLPF